MAEQKFLWNASRGKRLFVHLRLLRVASLGGCQTAQTGPRLPRPTTRQALDTRIRHAAALAMDGLPLDTHAKQSIQDANSLRLCQVCQECHRVGDRKAGVTKGNERKDVGAISPATCGQKRTSVAGRWPSPRLGRDRYPARCCAAWWGIVSGALAKGVVSKPSFRGMERPVTPLGDT